LGKDPLFAGDPRRPSSPENFPLEKMLSVCFKANQKGGKRSPGGAVARWKRGDWSKGPNYVGK